MADTAPELTPPFPEQSQAKPGLDARMKPRPRNQATAQRGSGKLDGQVAIITGGDSRIGASVCILFAREGADIAIGHLPAEEEDAAAVKALVESAGLGVPGDRTPHAGRVRPSRYPRQQLRRYVRTLVP